MAHHSVSVVFTSAADLQDTNVTDGCCSREQIRRFCTDEDFITTTSGWRWRADDLTKTFSFSDYNRHLPVIAVTTVTTVTTALFVLLLLVFYCNMDLIIIVNVVREVLILKAIPRIMGTCRRTCSNANSTRYSCICSISSIRVCSLCCSSVTALEVPRLH